MGGVKGAVSGGHEHTVRAAEEVLLAGGNAVDAAIAAYWMMFFAEPCMASMGAGGFAMVHFEGGVSSLDFFCQTPKYKRAAEDIDFYPITVDFGSATEDFYVGRGAVTTPGAIAGIFDLHQRFATIPMRDLVQPTVQAAKEGILLDSFQSYDWHLLRSIFGIDPSVRHIFFKDGAIKEEGDEVRMPGLADTLSTLAIEGSDLFYRGEIAQEVASHGDGSLCMEDFEQYHTIWRKPIRYPWQGYTLCTTPDPSMGGAILCKLLADFSTQNPSLNTAAHSRHWAHAIADTYRRSRDMPSFYRHLQQHYGLALSMADAGGEKRSGTSHFNVVDRWGNAVALTSSIGEGNGNFVPGTDMQMNNMLGEAALLPNGYHSWQPDTRLKSMMTPTSLIDDQGQIRLLIGSGGAGRIPYVLAQTMSYHIQHGLPLDPAIHAPKLCFDGQTMQMEPGMDASGPEEYPVNQWEQSSLYFGGTHSIAQVDGQWVAAPDRRRHGAARVIGD